MVEVIFWKTRGKVFAANSLFGPGLLFLEHLKRNFHGSFSDGGRQANENGAPYQNSQTRPRELVRRILFFTPENKLSRFQIIPTNGGPRMGSSIIRRTRHIETSVICQACRDDKGGYGRFLKILKYHLFGNFPTRMTAARCEECFNDDDNFGS